MQRQAPYTPRPFRLNVNVNSGALYFNIEVRVLTMSGSPLPSPDLTFYDKIEIKVENATQLWNEYVTWVLNIETRFRILYPGAIWTLNDRNLFINLAYRRLFESLSDGVTNVQVSYVVMDRIDYIDTNQ